MAVGGASSGGGSVPSNITITISSTTDGSSYVYSNQLSVNQVSDFVVKSNFYNFGGIYFVTRGIILNANVVQHRLRAMLSRARPHYALLVRCGTVAANRQ